VASLGKQHCANCVGTLSFPTVQLDKRRECVCLSTCECSTVLVITSCSRCRCCSYSRCSLCASRSASRLSVNLRSCSDLPHFSRSFCCFSARCRFRCSPSLNIRVTFASTSRSTSDLLTATDTHVSSTQATSSSTSTGFTFLVPAYPGRAGKKAVKRV